MRIFNTQQNFVLGDSRGFTMIEFVVIISIFAIIAAISLFNFSGFSSNISLANLAHDVALVIRGAQIEGISAISTSSTPEEPMPYGVFFEYDSVDGYSSKMVVFGDFDRNSQVTSQGEIVDTITIQSSDIISDVIVGQTPCDTEPGVHVLFIRPDPNPIIFCGPNLDVTNQSESYMGVVVSSQDGSQSKTIEVQLTGQINVD